MLRVFSTFQKSTKKMAKPVSSGYSDFGQNWKVRKTCCSCFKLIVLMKEQHFECFRRIRRVFSTFPKINQKNQPKKSNNKMATPVRSGYSDFGHNWKVRKKCCFCFKLIVLMKEQNFECFRRIGRVFSTFQKINQKNGHAGKVRIQRYSWKLKIPQNMLFLLQTDSIDERTTFSMFQKNWKGIFNIWKTQPKTSTNKMATPVMSGYSDFGQNWKVRKTCCFFFKLIVLMKERNFECFRRIGRVFSIFEKLNLKKVDQQNGHAGNVRIQWFWSKLKSPQNMLFLLQTDCFDERTKFWMFHNNWKGIFDIWKTQPKKSTNKYAHAGNVRIQWFWSELKSPQNILLLLQTDCFDERTTFWMFQKNWKGIFNISKNQPKKSTNKMATPVRSGYSDFGHNWNVRKKCSFSFKLIVFIKEQNFECFRRIGRVFSTFQKINQKNSHAGKVRIQQFWWKF